MFKFLGKLAVLAIVAGAGFYFYQKDSAEISPEFFTAQVLLLEEKKNEIEAFVEDLEAKKDELDPSIDQISDGTEKVQASLAQLKAALELFQEGKADILSGMGNIKEKTVE